MSDTQSDGIEYWVFGIGGYQKSAFKLEIQKPEVRCQNRILTLGAFSFYMFRLSRRRIHYFEFCLQNFGFLLILVYQQRALLMPAWI